MIYQNREEYLSVKITNNNRYPAHLHRQIEIFYVLDGAIEITIENQKSLLTKGMASVAFPNMVHETHTPEHSSAVMMIFNADFLPDFYAEFHTQKPMIPFIDAFSDAQRLHCLMQELLNAMQKNTDIRIAKGYLYIIVSMLLSELTLIKQENISSGICQDISAYLNLHFTEDISLSQLAAALGYSKYHISHIFKETFGCSYSGYLKQLRAEYAMGLLTHSDMSVTEICFASGFNSLRTFYRAFDEVYQATPTSVRHISGKSQSMFEKENIR
ncbi:MAG: AraC family transcriptional regulator [Lachnospiraceae bacterium]|nr:AraC family transcriptional regulator [Lachnospiraceae bacterium]